MHECFLKQSRMGTARMNEDKDSEEKGKKRGVKMQRSKPEARKEVPMAYRPLLLVATPQGIG